MGVLDDAIKEHLELKRKHGVPEEELQRQEEEALGPARRDVAQQPEDDRARAGRPWPPRPTATAAPATEPEEPAAAEDTAIVEDAPEAEQSRRWSSRSRRCTSRSTAEPDDGARSRPAEEAGRSREASIPRRPPPTSRPPSTSPWSRRPWSRLRSSLRRSRRSRRRGEPTRDEPVGEPGHEPIDPASARPSRTGSTRSRRTSSRRRTSRSSPPRTRRTILASDPEDEELDVLEDTPDFLQETPEHDRLWFEQKPPRDFDFD